MAFVTGKNLVPLPATGKIAFLIDFIKQTASLNLVIALSYIILKHKKVFFTFHFNFL
jgi:hypothetical protein